VAEKGRDAREWRGVWVHHVVYLALRGRQFQPRLKATACYVLFARSITWDPTV